MCVCVHMRVRVFCNVREPTKSALPPARQNIGHCITPELTLSEKASLLRFRARKETLWLLQP